MASDRSESNYDSIAPESRLGQSVLVRWALSHQFIVPVILFVFIAAITIVLWKMEQAEQEGHLEDKLSIAQSQLTHRWADMINSQARPLRRLRKDILRGRQWNEKEFDEEVDSLRAEITTIQTIARVDAQGICRVMSPRECDREMMGNDLRNVPDWGPAIRRAEKNSVNAAGNVLPDCCTGEPTVLFVVPIIRDSSAEPKYEGALIGKMRLQIMVNLFLYPQTRKDFVIDIFDGGKLVWQTGKPSDRTAYCRDGEFPTLDRTWHVDIWPTRQFMEANRSHSEPWILWGGLGCSLLASGVVFQFIEHRRKELGQTRRHVEALESINQISAAISAKLGSGQEVLNQLAKSSEELLMMPISVIVLRKAAADVVDVLLCRGFALPPKERDLRLEEYPSIRQCLESEEILAIEDVERVDIPVNQQMLRQYQIRAIMTIPLSMEGRIIGAMLLGDTRPHRFTETDIHLAKLWGSQAAVTLANDSLYRQMNQAISSQKKLIEQREILYALSTEIYKAEEFDRPLRRLVERAPSALDVDICAVNLLTDQRDEFYMAAVTGGVASGLGMRFAVKGSNGEKVILTRQLLAIEDAVPDSTVNPYFKKVQRAQSVMYLPLIGSNDNPIGMITLIRHAPGPFSQEQKDMAAVFVTRAAAVIEKARLYQQVQRDAETKAILLRELNHRVKNNLAGIVGLLSIADPDLPPRAQQWLNRVVERIGTMARTHDLFSSGLESVGLSQLIAQMLPSLAIIKSPAIVIRTELDGINVSLNTEQAINLAMVLHELCYNGIVHGLGKQGTLTIRANLAADERVVIEVVDEGSNTIAHESAETSASSWVTSTYSRSSGLGLKLVQGLVGRELHGTFSLRTRSEGGTVATVEFPLNKNKPGTTLS